METTEARPARPQRGDELELTIDSLAFGGAGVARTDGYVVFVAGAMPGDRVRAVIGKRKRAYAEARVIEIIEPSPDRIEPAADHPARHGRCCPTSASSRSSRHRSTTRCAGSASSTASSWSRSCPRVAQWRYRNKLEYSFGTDADGRLVCGFHAPGRWDEIVGLTDCLLASERANAAREQIVQWCREQGLTAYDRRSGAGVLRNLVVREGRRTEPSRSVSSPRRGQLDRDSLAAAGAGLDGLLWTRQDSVGETTQGGETELLAGRERFVEVLGSMRLRISPRRSFRPTPRWPSSSTSSRSSTRSRAASSASMTCTAGSARSRCRSAPGRRGVGPRARPRGDRRRDRQRARQRGRQRPLLRRRCPPRAGRAGGASRAARRR